MRLFSKTAILATTMVAAFAPGMALAQDSVSVRERPRPEYDPLGLRFGGFDMAAEVNLGVGTTDNVFGTQNNSQSDQIYTVAPSARLSSHWSRHAVEIAGGGEFRTYQDFSSEDANSGYLRALGRLDVGADTAITGIVRTAQDVESRTDPDSLQAADPVELSRNEASLSVRHQFNRVRVTGSYAHSAEDYDDAGVVDQDRRDRSEDAFTGRVEYALNPRVAVVGQVRADQRDYENLPILNSEGTRITAGVMLELTNLIHGEFGVGSFEREYEGGVTLDGVALSSNIEWYITQLTTIGVTAERNAEDVGASTSSPYVSTQLGFRVDHELLRNLILSANLTSVTREYESIDREDQGSYRGVEVQYLVNRRVALSGRYGHEENESSGADRYRDFEADVFYLGVGLRL